MTNKKDENEVTRDCNPRVAALLAVHLVSQVLDEAYVIANAARETGQPWRNLSMLKSFKDSRLDETYIDTSLSFEASKGDNENKMEVVANVVATSTPQKLASKHMRGSDASQNPLNDFIGQGDEEDTHQDEISNSTSMFINHLFDMSEVERVIMCDDNEVSQNEPNEFLAEAMVKIMDSYVSNNIMTLDLPVLTDEDIKDTNVPVNSNTTVNRSDHSEFSFLADAFMADVGKNVAFFIDEDTHHEDNYYKKDDSARAQKIVEIKDDPVVNVTESEKQRKDVDMYEKAYMTLNSESVVFVDLDSWLSGDYDQCSDEDGFPVLQDPKEMTLQEVELLTTNTSEENYPSNETQQSLFQKDKEVATVSAASGSRKSTLVRRCRMQGARILACIRGWWRRKTPGKRREPKMSDAVKGICPLSPDSRRRTSSLLDSRRMRSPSPSRPVIWKFNTVNEALVNSNHWKDYTFDVNPGQCGETLI